MRTLLRLFPHLAAAAILVIPLLRTAAQNGSATRKPSRTKPAWTPPRTPYGDPDIQGIWSNASIIAGSSWCDDPLASLAFFGLKAACPIAPFPPFSRLRVATDIPKVSAARRTLTERSLEDGSGPREFDTISPANAFSDLRSEWRACPGGLHATEEPASSKVLETCETAWRAKWSPASQASSWIRQSFIGAGSCWFHTMPWIESPCIRGGPALAFGAAASAAPTPPARNFRRLWVVAGCDIAFSSA